MATRSREKSAARKANADKRARCTAKYVRIPSRKVHIILDLIRGKSADQALAILMNTPKAAAPIVAKVLNSAIANAENNKQFACFTNYDQNTGEGKLILASFNEDGVSSYGELEDDVVSFQFAGEGSRIAYMRGVQDDGSGTLMYVESNIADEISDSAYYYEVAEFMDLIQSGRRESAVNSHHNSLCTMLIMDEIRRQTGVVFPADGVSPVEGRDGTRPQSQTVSQTPDCSIRSI